MISLIYSITLRSGLFILPTDQAYERPPTETSYILPFVSALCLGGLRAFAGEGETLQEEIGQGDQDRRIGR